MEHLVLNIIRIGIVFTLGEYMNRSRERLGVKAPAIPSYTSVYCKLPTLASDEIDIISGLIHVVFQKQGL